MRLSFSLVSYGTILAYGDNSDRELYSGCGYGYHAETAAIKKLTSCGRRRCSGKLDLIVVRVNRKGLLRNSKPCTKCLSHLAKLRGYRIRFVFYSNSDGTISKVRFAELLAESDGHVSKRFQAG